MGKRRSRPGGNNNITVNAPVIGTGIVSIGHQTAINVEHTAGLSSADLATLLESLKDLYANLGTAALPLETQMQAQTATGLAVKTAQEPGAHAESLATHLKAAGEVLQEAGITVEEGSHLASSILQVARTFGPLVVGGAHVVAGWFGLHLP